MSYPSDANLMRRLSDKCYKLLEYLKSKGTDYLPQMPTIDIKKISEQAKKYFFLSKNTCMKKKQEVFSAYHSLVSNQLMPFIKLLQELPAEVLQKLPWNYRQAATTIKQKASGYLSDVAHFVKTNTLEKGKILSLKLKDIICIKKGKLGKAFRVWQSISSGPNRWKFYGTLYEHFLKNDRQGVVNSYYQGASTDIWSGSFTVRNNRQGLLLTRQCQVCGRVYRKCRWHPKDLRISRIRSRAPRNKNYTIRRAGVEPIIGHIKRFGLGKKQNEIRQSHSILRVPLQSQASIFIN